MAGVPLMRRLLLALAFLVGLPTWGANQYFHVAPGGNDANTGCPSSDGSGYSVSCAKLTLGGAVNAWSGTGNTVLLHAGTIRTNAACLEGYPTVGPPSISSGLVIEGVCAGGSNAGNMCAFSGATQCPGSTCTFNAKSGAAGAYNVIKGAGDGTVTLSATNGGVACDHMLYINADYIQIGSLTPGEGITIAGDATFERIPGGFPATDGITLEGSNNRLYGLNVLANNSPTYALGEAGQGQIGVYGTNITGNHIAGNTIRLGSIQVGVSMDNSGTPANTDCDGAGDDSFPANTLIENNTFLYDNSDNTRGQTSHNFIGGKSNRDTVIRNNYFRIGTSASFVAGDTYATTFRSACRASYINNYYELWTPASSTPGMLWNFNNDNASNQRYKAYNNTFYGRIGPNVIHWPGCGGCEIANIVCRGTVGAGINTCVGNSPSTNVMTVGYIAASNVNNVTDLGPNVINLGGNVTSNPLLTESGSKPTPFFQLQSGSPLINAGCPTVTCPGCPAVTCPNAPTTDYDGQTRSNPPDIGADEFGAGTPDTTVPSTMVITAGTPAATTCPITWNAPYDDTPTTGGAVASYDCRICTQSSCSTTMSDTEYGLGSAACGPTINAPCSLLGEPAPSAPPAAQTPAFTAAGLTSGTDYVVACKAIDEAVNTSAISNSVTFTTATGDSSGPATIDLSVAPPSKAPQLGAVITWFAPADVPSGNAASYQLIGKGDAADGVYPTIANCLDGAQLTGVVVVNTGAVVTTLPTPSPAGIQESWRIMGLRPNTDYSFALCSRDAGNTQSALSDVVSITTAKYEGYGYQSTGAGFTGSVPPVICPVTTTADSGAGSLRTCAVSGNYVAFAVGGQLNLLTRLNLRPFVGVTFDGSTAPSPGFTIHPTTDFDDAMRLGNGDNVIMTYLRLTGNWNWLGAEPSEIADMMIVNNIDATGVTNHLVWDHITARNIGDSGMDMYDAVTNATVSRNFIMRNKHPMTTGGDPGSLGVSIHHNLWAQNGERQPQFTTAALGAGVISDFDLRNNIHYHWDYDPNPSEPHDPGTYAIRVRNQTRCVGGTTPGAVCISGTSCGVGGTCESHPVKKIEDLNIINNYFSLGPGSVHTRSAIVYGSAVGTAGGDGGATGEENGPTCTALTTGQGTVEAGTHMGDIFVSGNVLPTGTCDSYSTVSSASTVPAAAAVTTDDATSLSITVLSNVGTHYPLADETALIALVYATITTCGDGTVQAAETCDGANLDGETCVSQGFSGGGTLACAGDCLSFVTSGCSTSALEKSLHSTTLEGATIE